MVSTPPARSSFVLAFTVVYLVWGSTYFAMRILVAEVPPFAGASARFLIAGVQVCEPGSASSSAWRDC